MSLSILHTVVVAISVFNLLLMQGNASKFNTAPTHSFESKRMKVAMQTAILIQDALFKYTIAHSDHLPGAEKWEDALRPYLPADFTFALPPLDGKPRRFALNKALAGVNIASLSEADPKIFLFETSSHMPSVVGDMGLLPPSIKKLGWVTVEIFKYHPMAHYYKAQERLLLIKRADPNYNPYINEQ